MRLDGIKDVNSLSVQEISRELRNMGYTKDSETFNAEQIGIACTKINELLGLKLDGEQFQFLMTDKSRVLCEATAGSGKTTVSQLKILRNKIFFNMRGDRCLCLAFNEHSVQDMITRHRSLVEPIHKYITDVNIDSDIVCRTLHSNAMAWIKEYYRECGLKYDKDLIAREDNLVKGMRKAVETVCKKENIKLDLKGSSLSALIKASKYIRESMTPKKDWEAIEDIQKFRASDSRLTALTTDHIEIIFKKYELFKRMTSGWDFTNMLEMFKELLETNEEARKRIQNAYYMIIADECQDMSQLMMKCMQLMVGENTQLVMIGDGDQSIYGFMGTKPDNCLRFKDYFPTGIVVSMSKNRRCPANVVKVARDFIETNTKRYQKAIHTDNPVGTIKNRLYKNTTSQVNDICEYLKSLTPLQLNNTCIAYRNKDSSYLLTRHLLKNNIPFRIGSGFAPYVDLLSRKLDSIMNFLSNTRFKYYQEQALPLLLPYVRKDDIAEKIRRSKEGDDWTDYEWDLNVRNFKESVVLLDDAIQAVRAKKPMSEYFAIVFSLFRRYYWDFTRANINFSKSLESEIIAQYSQNITYDEFLEQKSKAKQNLEEMKRTGRGALCTTFHTTKGLEFDTMILMDLEESIFPNFRKIDSIPSSDEVKIDLKEETVRLFYVAMTRAKKNLFMYWNKENPSVFLDKIQRSNFECNKAIKENISISDMLKHDSLEEDIMNGLNLEDNTKEVNEPDNNELDNDGLDNNELELDLGDELELDLNDELELNDELDDDDIEGLEELNNTEPDDMKSLTIDKSTEPLTNNSSTHEPLTDNGSTSEPLTTGSEATPSETEKDTEIVPEVPTNTQQLGNIELQNNRVSRILGLLKNR